MVCLALIGSFAGIGLAFARPANDARAAAALKSLLLWARAEAMWQGIAVAVTELPLGVGFEVVRLPPGAATCGAGETIGRLWLADHPGVRIATGFGARRGLVWLPTGSGRSCDGSGVISSSLELRGHTRATRVVVSSLGRVRVERAP